MVVSVRVILKLCQRLMAPDGEDFEVLVALEVNFEGSGFSVVFVSCEIVVVS